MSGADVFISYARADRSFVDRLSHRLGQLGITVWFDQGIKPRSDFAAEILNNLHGARVVLVCWSPNANRSSWVFAEAMAAFHKQNLFPVRIGEGIPPQPFSALQSLDLSRWQGYLLSEEWIAVLRELEVALSRNDLVARNQALEARRDDSKRIVVCCDGMWETGVQTSPTNVARIAQLLPRRARDGRLQVVAYRVGGQFRASKIALVNAMGIEDRVLETYLTICENFSPGDQIFLFGASRGAYVARAVAALIGKCGLLRHDQIQMATSASELWRDLSATSEKILAFREAFAHEAPPTVDYLGVMETVGQRGIPSVFGPLTEWANRRYTFHDLNVGHHVRSARHAVAIDERRAAFPPSLWNNVDELNARLGAAEAPVEQRPFQQLWFPGNHYSIVGSSEESRGISNHVLLWQLDGAEALGLDVGKDSYAYNEATQGDDPVNAKIVGVNAVGLLSPLHWAGPHRSIPANNALAPAALLRWERNSKYRPLPLRKWLRKNGLQTPSATPAEN